MKTTAALFLASLSSVAYLAAETSPDFVRFKNGDTLNGTYQGLDEGPLVKILSPEAQEVISFQTKNLRKLSLNGGRAPSQLSGVGLVELNNGDRIPGNIISMGTDSISIQTEFAGLLTIPRNSATLVLPNRFGGDVFYAGPFSEENWQFPTTPAPEKSTAEAAADTDSDDDADKEEKAEIAEPPAPWKFGTAAWYSNSTELIRLDTELPDKVSIRFSLAWKGSLDARLGVFSDFRRPADEKARVRRVPDLEPVEIEEKPEDEEEAEDENPADEKEAAEEEAEEESEPEFVDIMQAGTGTSDPETFGSGYLISVMSSYCRLQRLGFDERQRDRKTSFTNSGGRFNFRDLYAAEFEIRASRTEGIMALFVNGEFYSEWQDLAEPLSDVPRYFSIAAGTKARLRVSDVVISEWNGMPDSARSMENDERDVLLLTNGTDRVSGDILNMEEDLFQVQTSYGLLQIPAPEVSNIHLANAKVEAAPESESGQVLVSLQPNGLVTLKPKEGLAKSLSGEHPILGEMELDLNYAYLLEFDPIGTIFDNWDDEF